MRITILPLLLVACAQPPTMGESDAGFRIIDAGRGDGPVDAGPSPDAGQVREAGPVADGGSPEAGSVDAGPLDAGPLDAGPPAPCDAYFLLDLRRRNPRPGRVALAGSFNDWATDAEGLTQLLPGLYGTTVSLQPGSHRYKYAIGDDWFTDPGQPALSEDENGNLNSLIEHRCRRADAAVLRIGETSGGAGLRSQTYLIAPGLSAVTSNQTELSYVLEGGRQLTVEFPGGLGKTAEIILHFEDDSQRVLRVGPAPEGEADWRRGTLYFAMVDRFSNGDPNNDLAFNSSVQPVNYQGGDLRGLGDRVEAGYFDDLGTSALWITWPMQGPNRPMDGHRLDLDPRQSGCGLNPYDDQLPRQEVRYSGFHGYWPVDLEQVDPRFGDAAALRRLVDLAHARGIAVLLDLPANHLHEDHPVAQDEARADWFNRPAQVCGRDVPWDDAPETCWFTSYLPDLNLGHGPARRWLVHQAVGIAERFGLDGFRIDAVKHLDRRFLRDLRHAAGARLEAGGQPFWTIGETFSGDAPSLASYLGADGVHAQFDFPLNRQLLQSFAHGFDSMGHLDATARRIKATYDQELMVNFVGNHDIARFVSLANAQLCGTWDMASNQALGWVNPPQAPWQRLPYQRLLQALTYAFTIPGQPMIYYGDEFGMPGGGDPDNRRFMRFGRDLNENETWLRGEVAKLAALRQNNDGLRAGAWPGPAVADQNTIAFVRSGETSDALVIINRGAARSLHLALIEARMHGELVEAFSGAVGRMESGSGMTFELPAESVQIWTRRP